MSAWGILKSPYYRYLPEVWGGAYYVSCQSGCSANQSGFSANFYVEIK